MQKDDYQVSVLIFLTDAFTLSGTTWGLKVHYGEVHISYAVDFLTVLQGWLAAVVLYSLKFGI